MSLVANVSRAISHASFAIGTLWGAAGTAKAIFGVRMTVAGLPHLGLEAVDIGTAFAVMGACALVGAVTGRHATTHGGAAHAGSRPSGVRPPNEALPLSGMPVEGSAAVLVSGARLAPNTRS